MLPFFRVVPSMLSSCTHVPTWQSQPAPPCKIHPLYATSQSSTSFWIQHLELHYPLWSQMFSRRATNKFRMCRSKPPWTFPVFSEAPSQVPRWMVTAPHALEPSSSKSETISPAQSATEKAHKRLHTVDSTWNLRWREYFCGAQSPKWNVPLGSLCLFFHRHLRSNREYFKKLFSFPLLIKRSLSSNQI